MFAFCEDVGLPTTLADIGLATVDRDRLLRVAEKACAPGEYIHHEAGTITPGNVSQVMLAVNAVGAHRKQQPQA